MSEQNSPAPTRLVVAVGRPLRKKKKKKGSQPEFSENVGMMMMMRQTFF